MTLVQRRQLENELLSESPRSATGYIAYAIYADYNANAPNSEDLVHFASQEQADFVAKLGNDIHEHDNGHDRESDWLEWNGRVYRVPLGAVCEGWEWCKSYKVRDIVVGENVTIYCSVAEWLEHEADESMDLDEFQEDAEKRQHEN